MDSTDQQLVTLEVQDDDSTVIVLRVNDQWICAEASPGDLQNTSLRKQYDELVQRHRRQQTLEDQLAQQESQPAQDSGYGSDEDAPDSKESLEVQLASEDGKSLLQNWMIEVLSDTCQKIATEKNEAKKRSLADWYIAPINFYNITASAEDTEHLLVESRDDIDGNDYIRDYLMPHIRAPKYVQELDLPWFAPEDVLVEDEVANEQASIHPTLLSVPADRSESSEQPKEEESGERSQDGQDDSKSDRIQYFFKLATHGDASSVKREIQMLETLRKKDLYSKGVRAPRLVGFVEMPQRFRKKQKNAKSELLGILLTVVPAPAVPLNHYMDSSIKQEKRAAFAAEAQTMVEVLHEHDIIWGDAKADNFLVDGHGKLWMIDFGGNFTPGWVDAELADTVEGDDMGTEKITLGLEYPEDYVHPEVDEDDPNDEDYCEPAEDAARQSKRKRNNRDEEDTSEDEDAEPSKSQRRQ